MPLGHTLLTKILSIRVADPSAKHRIDTINFFTALKVAYAGFMRLGEITYPNNATALQLVAGRYILHSDVAILSDHATLHLCHSKADRKNKGVYIPLARTGNFTCPVTALEQLFATDPQPIDAPLF